jgi:hypothetical protein
MERHDCGTRLVDAAEEFDRHEDRRNGARVAGCLANGLAILRESLYRRVHEDVQRVVGRDSMLLPISDLKTHERATEEIEIYQAAESAVATGQYGYLHKPDEWYVPWLARLRLGQRGLDAELTERAQKYLSATADGRRLAFMRVLGQVLRESGRAPLVLFRLLPLSVHIATACAFGDHAAAADLRRQQIAILPAITDCRQCRGRVLECVEQCRACGNPLWEYEWLLVAD